jgi:hypothetical protein
VSVSGAADVSKSLISLFSPYLEPTIEFGSAGVPISPVSRMAAPFVYSSYDYGAGSQPQFVPPTPM